MEWFGLVAVSLPGLAALAALLFTGMQVGQANKELRISEQGQITNRFNAAITNLGSDSLDVRLGGIYGLERIMQDSPRDRATVVSVLTAYVRRHAPLPGAGTKKQQRTSPEVSLPTDIAAVMHVLAKRPFGVGELFALDLSRTDLRGLRSGQGRSKFADVSFREANLAGAELNRADLTSATLSGAILRAADLTGASLSGAGLINADLSDARLTSADLTSANLTNANLTNAHLNGASLTSAVLNGAVLRAASLSGALLSGAGLANADLSDARLNAGQLRGADLTNADLTNADLTGADLTGADTTDARLTGAKLDGVRGLPASRR
ncbi:pentapeptide repeat-containing protein [Streptomyces sp. NPDC006283]|uniref:pentapeptide repeat-containing protein n=1 Tax=Streptomyces sp. NPDC006283 TaxID=3156741 RepID=UPI0033B50728